MLPDRRRLRESRTEPGGADLLRLERGEVRVVCCPTRELAIPEDRGVPRGHARLYRGVEGIDVRRVDARRRIAVPTTELQRAQDRAG